MDNQLANLSSIHDAVYSITHHNYNNMCILIFFRDIIQDIVNTDTVLQPVLKPYNPGHKHDRNVHRFYIKLLTDSSTVV